jgi:hypothetical protein
MMNPPVVEPACMCGACSGPVVSVGEDLNLHGTSSEPLCLRALGEVDINLAPANLSAGVADHVFSGVFAGVVDADPGAKRKN